MQGLAYFLFCNVILGTSATMLDTSISCTDTDCPEGMECVIPQCMVDPCLPIQPICLPLDAPETLILEHDHHVIDHHTVTHHEKHRLPVEAPQPESESTEEDEFDYLQIQIPKETPTLRRYTLHRPKSLSP